MASAQIHQRVAPAAGCNWQKQQHVVNGAGAPPALARWKESHTSVLDANACFKQAKEYDQGAMMLLHAAEPTSVLDLQTSPGRSCSSSTVSLSSQQSSLSSSDDSTFAVAPGQSTVAQKIQHVRSSSKDESSGNSRTALMVEDLSDHAPGAALQVHEVEPEFPSWMDCMEDAAHDSHIANDMDFANVPDMGFEYGMSSCFEMSEDSCFPIFVGDQDIMLSEPPELNCYPLDELKFFNPSTLICRSTVTAPLHEASNDVALANESVIPDHPQLVSCSALIDCTTGTTLCGGAPEIQLYEQPVLQTPEFIRSLCMGSQLNDNGSYNPPQFSQSLHSSSLFDGEAGEIVTYCEEISAHSPGTRSICLGGQARSSCYWTAAASDQGPVVPIQETAPDSGGLQLVHLLLACAEAINGSDYELARPTLCHLRAISSPYGDPMQRIAFHFAEALTERLSNSTSSYSTVPADDDMKLAPRAAAGGTPNAGHASSSSRPSVLESELAYQSFYQVLPFEKFAHFTGNQAIVEAVASNHRVHVLDLDVGQGLQWPAFFQSLALRPGGPPAHLRLTAVGSNSYALQQTGRRLIEFARTLDLSFEFNPVVAEKIENLIHHGTLNMIQLNSDETLVINCSQVLHRLLTTPSSSTSKQSSSCAALENLLHMIRNMNPKLVTLLEVEANHDNSNFISRFVEALHYYSALFDTLEATLPRESSQRSEIENTAFASQIKQIVAVEQVEEVVEVTNSSSTRSCCRRREAAAAPHPPRRHMRSHNWQTHFQDAGFRVVPPSSYAVEQAHQLLNFYKLQQQQWLLHCNAMPYKLAQDTAVQEVLTLGWQDTPIIAVSSWTVAEL